MIPFSLKLIFFVILLMLFTVEAFARTFTYRTEIPGVGKAVIRIFDDRPCVSLPVLEYMRENILDDRRFKAAHMEWGPDPYDACYIEVDGQVYLIGSDKVPLRPLKREKFLDESI